jgi:serine/threonine protein kinase
MDLSRTGSLHGKRFGNYIASQRIGQGGMGSVYKAVHPEIGREVAIKVLTRHHNEEMLQRFLEEARTIARIGHPNIVDIYDFGRTKDDRLYYVMEWLEGRELREDMNEKIPMAGEEIMPYLEQICAGLQAAHDSGVIHRDLKPANIYVLGREPLTLKILDFGVAKLLDAPPSSHLTSPGIMIGTPMFSSPEQAAAELDKLCPQTDLYALGIILYWMLTGQPPFMADNNAVLLAMHITDKPKPILELNPTIPTGIAHLVQRCLAKEPSDRPRSALELYNAWSAVMKQKQSGKVVDDDREGFDDGPSGILVFVPVTPVEEVVPTEVSAGVETPAGADEEREAVVTLDPRITAEDLRREEEERKRREARETSGPRISQEVIETPTAVETPAAKRTSSHEAAARPQPRQPEEPASVEEPEQEKPEEPKPAEAAPDPADASNRKEEARPPEPAYTGALRRTPTQVPADTTTEPAIRRGVHPWLPWVLMGIAVIVAVLLALVR